MKPVRVLDPGHVLAVCTYAAYDPGEAPPLPLPKIALTATEEAVIIRIAADKARIAAILRALHQAGYDATAEAADEDTITVRGWSPTRLHKRIAQLDTAVQWLTEQLAFTPRTAVAQYQIGIEPPAALTGRDARNRARHLVVRNLRGLMQNQTGLPTWQAPSGHPTDPRVGILLHQCQWLEDEVDLLLSRHRAIATQAIAEHRLKSETEHPGQAEQGGADRAAQPADGTTQAMSPWPADVAAHDAPATAGSPSVPGPSSTEPERDVRPATSPARRGA